MSGVGIEILDKMMLLNRDVFQRSSIPVPHGDLSATTPLTSGGMGQYSTIAREIEAPAWDLIEGELQERNKRQRAWTLFGVGEISFPPLEEARAASIYHEAGRAYAKEGFLLKAASVMIRSARLYGDINDNEGPDNKLSSYELAGQRMLDSIVLSGFALDATGRAIARGYDTRIPIRANYPHLMRSWNGYGFRTVTDNDPRREGKEIAQIVACRMIEKSFVGLLDIIAKHGKESDRIKAFQSAEEILGNGKKLAEKWDTYSRNSSLQNHIAWYIKATQGNT